VNFDENFFMRLLKLEECSRKVVGPMGLCTNTWFF